MIDDNSATIGSETPHQMSQSEYALVQNLTALYGEGGASYLAKRLMAIAMGELMSGPADTAPTEFNLCQRSDAYLLRRQHPR